MLSVLITDQVCEPVADPAEIEPETVVLDCGARGFVPEVKLVADKTPPEESKIARLEPPVGVELVIVPLTPTLVPTSALVTPPVVIVKVAA